MGYQAICSLPNVPWGQVRTPHHHLQRPVPWQLGHSSQFNHGHHKPRGKTMPQIVPHKRRDAGLLHCGPNPSLPVAPTPTRRVISATATPASASFNTPTICSSLKRLFSIAPPGPRPKTGAGGSTQEEQHFNWSNFRGAGQNDGLPIEMWVNTVTKEIETAYSLFR